MKDFTGANSTLVFFVNGKKVIDDTVDPEWTLLYYLRNKLRLCGTKLGCAEGGCGACTVMVSKYNRKENKISHYAVNACLAPICSMHGLAVTTVEGIGSVKTKLHPVQERIAKAHGSQCGFCTPGIVMSMYALLRSLPGKPTMKDLEVAFQGNLCRCTGYRPIIEGYKTFTEEWEQQQRLAAQSNGVCAMGENCCRNQKNKQTITNGVSNGYEVNGVNSDMKNGIENNGNCCRSNDKLFDPNTFLPYNESQEPIFPPELKINDSYDAHNVVIKGPRAIWYRINTLADLLELKDQYPKAKLVNGNTEIGVEVKFKNCLYPVLIQPNQILELITIKEDKNYLKIGAAVTLSEMEAALNQQINSKPEVKVQVFKAIVEMLHWFAGKQIRNVSAVGGNIMTGSPISDLNPIFMAAGCTLEVQSKANGTRILQFDEKFWTGYRRNIVRDDEILVAINVPFTEDKQFFMAYKQAKRRDDDIAIVNAAFNLKLNDDNKIEKISFAYGGMAPTTVMAPKTSKLLLKRFWNNETLNDAYKNLSDELPLDPSAPGGMIQYRRSLTLSFLLKFYLHVCLQMEKNGNKINEIPQNYRSGKDMYHTLTPKSSQYYTIVPSTQEKYDLVGRPIVHQSAYKQASGEAVYCDDIPKAEGELYLALVTSTKTHAKIKNMDASEALKIDGVVAFFSSEDIPSHLNNFGPVVHDEEIFATEKVTCQGQVIGAIVAENQLIAQRAAKIVKVDYEEIEPVIVTIEDAIKAKSFYENPMVVKRGDPDKIFDSANNIVEGELRIGGQEHFYLETQAALAIPKKEDDEMEIWCSTQHPTELQHLVSHVLNVQSNRITCKVKRMGGGFGGKESRSSLIALPVAVAAYKLNRPVRAMLDRDEDMYLTGERHPFHGKYKVAYTENGKITACEITLYNNAGNTADLSKAVMERAMFSCENSSYIENIRIKGYVCKTNLPSNTAFRGFGAPQGMLVSETMIRHISESSGVDPIKVHEINMYKEGNTTPYNQPLEYCTLPRCWKECIENSNYYERKTQIEKFNKEHRWKKRGITVIPTKFGISFTTLFLNQAGALILIYQDGSVLLTHGGTEMGQGLHTKMIQVASRALEIPGDLIHISETATDKVPNTSATAASAGSDLNGMAVLNACNIINERLKPIKEANPKGTWKHWIQAAYLSRISLSVSGFYKTPDIGYNMETNTGKPFNYFTYGAACSEVEIDCLTGDHQVLRTDIVMDLGESINPAIDIGQVEGAFMQGYGLFTLEELIVSPTGILYSRGPGAYKIPGFADIPAEFNVSLLKEAPNPRAVYSSKAVGEPPLFLASSIYFGIIEAIKDARKEIGQGNEYFRLDSPATSCRIRMACKDEITEKFPEPPKDSYKPWNITP